MALSLTSTFIQTQPLSAKLTTAPKKVKVNTARNPALKVSCRQKDIHPEVYYDAKVYCNGELVMTTGGTQKEYVVDVWSGNHPFFLGDRSALQVEADRVEKFRQKYGELTEFMEIPVLKGELELPPRIKSPKKK